MLKQMPWTDTSDLHNTMNFKRLHYNLSQAMYSKQRMH